MILNKGLHKDNNQLDQPEGTWANAKNLLFDKSSNVLSNENGFEEYSLNLPTNKTVIGKISINNRILLFFHDDNANNDEIGYLEENGLYNSLIISTKFNFNIDFPITIKIINENFIVFTDYYNNIRYLNLKNPENSEEIDFNLISPEDNVRTFLLAPSEGGDFPEGSYSAYYRLITKDGIATNYFNGSTKGRVLLSALGVSVLSSDPFSYSTQANENTESSNKSLYISFGSMSSNFEYADIVIIGYINNEVVARKKRIIAKSGISHISSFDGEVIELDEIFTTKKNLVINDIEIVNDDFLGQGVREEDEINYQKYANNIIVNIDTSKKSLDNANSLDRFNNSYLLRTLVPGEVYALYITLVYNDGRESRAFHIPGRAPVTGETSNSTTTGLTTYKKYQINDTSYNASTSPLTKCGYWENENETYPNLDDYDSTSLGGLDLRNKNVRHHKVPTFRQCQENNHAAPWNGNSYIFDLEVGRDALIRMNFSISNVVIPSNISSKIQGYKIYRAKRTIDNALVIGFAPVLFGGRMDNPSEQLEDQYVSICSNLNQNTGTAENEKVVPNVKTLKFHCLDLLKNKPKIQPVFVNAERVHRLNLENTAADSINSAISDSGILKNISTSGKQQFFTLHSHISDNNSTNRVNNGSAGGTSEVIKPVSKYSYIPENSIFPEFYNKYGEETLVLSGNYEYDRLVTGETAITFDTLLASPSVEITGLCSLRQVNRNVYSSFYNQNNLVSLGFDPILGSGTYSEIFESGDCMMGLDTIIHTAGAKGNLYEVDTEGVAKGLGTMAVRIYATYSVNFPMLRREDKSIDNGLVYLHTIDSKSIMENYDPTKQVYRDINDSFTYEDEVNSILTHNPFDTFFSYHPNRIIRFTSIDRELTTKMYLQYLSNSYFDLTQEKGKIKAINRIGENILIECEYGCYITRGKQSLQLDNTNAFIGNNDIFDITPKLILDSTGNYFGSQSKFTTLVTNYGVIIVDQLQGKVFLFNGSSTPQEISNIGLFNFFKDNLIYNEDNYVIKNYSSVDIISYDGNNLLITITKTTNLKKYTFENSDVIYLDTFEKYCNITNITEDSLYIYIYTDYSYNVLTVANVSITHYSKVDSPYNNNGVITSYDLRNKRFLLTKKNENSLEASLSYKNIYSSDSSYVNSLNIGDVYRYGSGYKKRGATISDINNLALSDLTDNSFTMSFNLEKGFWVSFHDYFPNLYLTNNVNLFSLKNNIIWKHDSQVKEKYNFYNTIHDCEIDIIFNKDVLTSKKFKELYWIVPFYSDTTYDNTKTFDSVELNSIEEEDSIINNLINLSNYTDINNQGNVRLLNGTWHFNKIRDTNNKVIFSKFLRIKLKTNKNYNLFIYEINCKFNYAKN